MPRTDVRVCAAVWQSKQCRILQNFDKLIRERRTFEELKYPNYKYLLLNMCKKSDFMCFCMQCEHSL